MKLLHPIPFVVLALLLAAPSSAFAAPGDSAPTMGDDDDDDDDEPAEEDQPEEDQPEEDQPEEDQADDDDGDDDGDDDDEDDEDDGEEDDVVDLPEIDNERAREREDERRREEAEEEEEEEADEDAGDARLSRADAREARRKARADAKRRLVKVIMPKAFLKYRKLELTPQIGLSNNDNFVRRLFLGLGVGFHINDLLSIEGTFAYLPNLEEVDYKPLTLRFREGEEVVPDISRVVFIGVANMALSPIFGKIELGNERIINYDIYFTAGVGVISSQDDMEIVNNADCLDHDNRAAREADLANGCNYVDQEHFVSNFGGGFRIVFNEWIGIRLDIRQYTHIEQVFREGEVGLEMKQNLFINIGATFFLPPGRTE
jgi:outer membrane beta-barrel protein